MYQPGGSFTTNANTTLYAKYSTTLTNYTVYLDVIDTGESYQNIETLVVLVALGPIVTSTVSKISPL